MATRIGKVFRGAAHTLEAVTSECGEFKKAWARAGKNDEPLVRHWKGEWQSDTNGHHGELRCVLRKGERDNLEAFFRAKYSRFLRACYKVKLAANRRGSAVEVHGKADLGALAGGKYEYNGSIEGREFHCRYRCRYDEGTFYLKAL